MTIARKVFAKSSTQTVHQIAKEYAGRQIPVGYVFPDGSVVRIEKMAIGYCGDDVANYVNGVILASVTETKLQVSLTGDLALLMLIESVGLGDELDKDKSA